VISRLAGKSRAPTDAKRPLRDRQAPGNGSPSAHQPVACHPPEQARGTVLSSQGSPGNEPSQSSQGERQLPPQLMTCLGLVPSEHGSESHCRNGSIKQAFVVSRLLLPT
jgi:hypothetical protein